jgi:hypothetical protein
MLAATAAILLLPHAAAASCRQPPPFDEHLGEADVIFVGTVMHLATGDDRIATFAIEEIWSGPELPAVVRVYGGEDPEMWTSVDRSFMAATRYLVAARLVDGKLMDDSCSATRPWHPDLVQFRPADARQPATEAATSTEQPLDYVPLPVLGLAALVLAGSILAFRSRT